MFYAFVYSPDVCSGTEIESNCSDWERLDKPPALPPKQRDLLNNSVSPLPDLTILPKSVKL